MYLYVLFKESMHGTLKTLDLNADFDVYLSPARGPVSREAHEGGMGLLTQVDPHL